MCVCVCVYRLLYKNLMVTINKKLTIDAHKKRKRNPNITLKSVIKPQDERPKVKKKPTKKIQND